MSLKTSIIIACIQLAALLVFVDGSVVLLGHLLGEAQLFTFPGGVGMAMSTAVCLMILSASIITLAGVVNHRAKIKTT